MPNKNGAAEKRRAYSELADKFRHMTKNSADEARFDESEAKKYEDAAAGQSKKNGKKGSRVSKSSRRHGKRPHRKGAAVKRHYKR